MEALNAFIYYEMALGTHNEAQALANLKRAIQLMTHRQIINDPDNLEDYLYKILESAHGAN